MTVDPQTLEQDFRTSVIGTLVAGQWFARQVEQQKSQPKNGVHTASASPFPLFLATAGLLHEVYASSPTIFPESIALNQQKNPMPSVASLSTVKSASYNLIVNFSQVLPEKYGIHVGVPIIVEPIIPKDGGGYATRSDPSTIVDKIFIPFFSWEGEEQWVRDRIW